MSDKPTHSGYCKHCGKNVTLIVIDEPPHLRGNCSECGNWVKWIPHVVAPEDEVLYFGKHKGKSFKEIPLDYLWWLFENTTTFLKERQKENLGKFLSDKTKLN